MYYPLSGFLFVGLGYYLSYYVIMSATKNLLEADKTLIVYYRVGDSSLKFRRTGSGLWGVVCGQGSCGFGEFWWGVAAGWVLVGSCGALSAGMVRALPIRTY